MAQAIDTRLLLFQGEWWESVLDGTPWWQQILGQAAGGREQKVALILQNRILGTSYVTGVTNLAFNFNPIDRSFKLSANVQTAFGTVAFGANYPRPGAQGIP